MRNQKVLDFEEHHWRSAWDMMGVQRASLNRGKDFQDWGTWHHSYPGLQPDKHQNITILEGLASFY